MTMLIALWLSLLLAPGLQTFGPGQPSAPPPATAAITGVVVDGAGGLPLPGAVVAMTGGTGSMRLSYREVTDAKGRFAFVNLYAGEYALTASKSGYLDGINTPSSDPDAQLSRIVVSAAEWMATARIPMWRSGAIGGRVTDERGEPVVGIYVRLLARVRVQGRDELAAGPIATTDDRGVFRFPGLPPGRYVAEVPSVQTSMPSAVPAPGGRLGGDAPAFLESDTSRLVLTKYPTPPPPMNGRPMAYPIAFYPSGATVEQAATIELKRAEQRGDIDIQLVAVPASRVSGTIIGPPDALTALNLRLLPLGLQSLGMGSEVATALVTPEGRFTFLNVPAGSYIVDAPRQLNELTVVTSASAAETALPQPPGYGGYSTRSDEIETLPGIAFGNRNIRGQAANYWGRAALEVNGREDVNMVLTLRPLASMSGRLSIDSDPARPDVKPPAFLQLALDPAGGTPASGMPRNEGGGLQPPGHEFTINGLMPTEYFLRYPLGSGWMLKSVSWNGRDYTDTPFDAAAATDFSGVRVTITNAVPTLAGRIRKAEGSAADGATVLVFPADRARWSAYGFLPPRFKSATAGNTGSFHVTTLPAGEYFVIALDRPPAAGWQDAVFLEKAQRSASQVMLSWGQASTLDLVVKEIR